MTGNEFYDMLRQTYTSDGQPLCKKLTFMEWLYKTKNNTYSFRFNVPGGNARAIPKDILIAAWEADEFIINDKWLKENFNLVFHKDFRLDVLNHLLNKYGHLRKLAVNAVQQ